MRSTRILTMLTAAGVALMLAPASSSAQPIQERAGASHLHGCYQLNQVVPGQPRGVHRVPCGVDVSSSVHR